MHKILKRVATIELRVNGRHIALLRRVDLIGAISHRLFGRSRRCGLLRNAILKGETIAELRHQSILVDIKKIFLDKLRHVLIGHTKGKHIVVVTYERDGLEP